MAELQTVQDFEPHIGTGFTITTTDLVEVFTLMAVEPGKPSYPGAREGFALLFNGSSNDLMINSQLVHFEHEVMGGLDIMISPFGRNDDGTFRYEAVFN